MEQISSQGWMILASYAVLGIGTSIILNTWWIRYYWACTIAAGISAFVFASGVVLLDGNRRAEGEGIMIALFAYLFFVPLTFSAGAVYKLVRRLTSA